MGHSFATVVSSTHDCLRFFSSWAKDVYDAWMLPIHSPLDVLETGRVAHRRAVIVVRGSILCRPATAFARNGMRHWTRKATTLQLCKACDNE